MAHTFYLYNKYSSADLAIDPTAPPANLSLRALQASDTPLAFTFAPINSTSFIKICTTVSAQPYCLDILGDNKYAPHLAGPTNDSGQQWSMINEGSSEFKLSNQFTGKGWYLDVYSDTKGAFMSSGDFAGQYWVQMNTSSSSTSTTSAPATSRSTPVASTSSIPTPNGQKGTKGLRAGAITGIAVGGALALIGIVGLIFAFFLKRKERRSRNVAYGTWPANPVPGFGESKPSHKITYAHELPGQGNFEPRELPGNR